MRHPIKLTKYGFGPLTYPPPLGAATCADQSYLRPHNHQYDSLQRDSSYYSQLNPIAFQLFQQYLCYWFACDLF